MKTSRFEYALLCSNAAIPYVDHNNSLYWNLYKIVKENHIDSYLEIGTREGHSAAITLLTKPEAMLRALFCDTWGNEYGGTGRGSHSHITQWINYYILCHRKGAKKTFRYNILNGRSQDTLKKYIKSKERKTFCEYFDLVLIDGEHSSNAVLNDLDAAWSLTKDGSFIVVHDINHPAHKEYGDSAIRWTQYRILDREISSYIIDMPGVGDYGTLILKRKG